MATPEPGAAVPRDVVPPTATTGDTSRARSIAALQRATGSMCTEATSRMHVQMPWFADLSAEDRSWVGVVVQSGVRSFVEWFAHDSLDGNDDEELAAALFGAAPPALAGVINLQQTVDLIRLSLEVVESSIASVVHPDDVPDVRAGVLRYAREVAFATAVVHARAAEVRGAWDARLEALVVDAVLRSEADEEMFSRASALGWAGRGDVAVVVGPVPGQRAERDVFDEVRRAARAAGMDALCATQGERVVVVLGGVDDAQDCADAVVSLFGPGAVVVGPAVPDLGSAHRSARAALSAHRAASGWPDAPRPVLSDDLMPERALAGDGHARRHLVESIFLPLAGARGEMIETLTTYFAQGGSLEGTARALYVHPNTVRYRLRQIADLTGLTPTQPRDGFTLQVALVLGRQSGRQPDL